MNNGEKNILPTANEHAEKKAYTKPELKKFGSLSELVQSLPGRGNDAGGSADCSLS